jgi:hypothetical protein
MSELKQITYEDADALLFINEEKQDTHVFLNGMGACWKTDRLREDMKRSKLYYVPLGFCGHEILMRPLDGKDYWLETDSEKVSKYMESNL